MIKYIIKRLLAMIPMLFAITLVSFTLMQLAPGTPAEMYQDPNKPAMTPEEAAEIEARLGLNQPIYVQYFKWVNELLHGNLGYSWRNSQPVFREMVRAVKVTIQLSVWTVFLSLILGISIGVYSALHQNKLADNVISFLTFISMSVPSFWIALMFILIFGVRLKVLPFIGLHDPLAMTFTKGQYIWDYIKHLIMPIFIMTTGSMSGWIRYERASFIEVLGQDYIRTARAKGLTTRQINWKHAFRNSALPIVTMIGGTLSGLVGGSFLIETVFSIPGMGRLGVVAMQNLDYPLIMGTLLFSSILVMLGTLLSDVLYVVVDPRIRFD